MKYIDGAVDSMMAMFVVMALQSALHGWKAVGISISACLFYFILFVSFLVYNYYLNLIKEKKFPFFGAFFLEFFLGLGLLIIFSESLLYLFYITAGVFFKYIAHGFSSLYLDYSSTNIIFAILLVGFQRRIVFYFSKKI